MNRERATSLKVMLLLLLSQIAPIMGPKELNLGNATSITLIRSFGIMLEKPVKFGTKDMEET